MKTLTQKWQYSMIPFAWHSGKDETLEAERSVVAERLEVRKLDLKVTGGNWRGWWNGSNSSRWWLQECRPSSQFLELHTKIVNFTSQKLSLHKPNFLKKYTQRNSLEAFLHSPNLAASLRQANYFMVSICGSDFDFSFTLPTRVYLGAPAMQWDPIWFSSSEVLKVCFLLWCPCEATG